MKNLKFLFVMIGLTMLSILPAKTHWQGPYQAHAVIVKRNAQITASATTIATASEKAEQGIASLGRTPLPGELLIQKDLAKTFRRVAEGGKEIFYHGDIAKEIVRFSKSKKNDGFIRQEDLDEFDVQWHEPISVNYDVDTDCLLLFQ